MRPLSLKANDASFNLDLFVKGRLPIEQGRLYTAFGRSYISDRKVRKTQADGPTDGPTDIVSKTIDLQSIQKDRQSDSVETNRTDIFDAGKEQIASVDEGMFRGQFQPEERKWLKKI